MLNNRIDSIQKLIIDFLNANNDRVIYSYKQEYRTHSINGKGLRDKVDRIRLLLNNNGIEKGDRIVLLGYSYLDWIAVYLAAILSGIVVVPLDVLSDNSLVRRINSQVRAKAIFQDKGLVNIGIKTFYLDEIDSIVSNIKHARLELASVKQNDTLEIMYTSGTTGEPKGVVITNSNLIAGINSAVDAVSIGIRLRMLNILPLSHIFGQVIGLFTAMYFSYHVFFMDTIKVRKIISYIKNKRIHAAILVPGILEAMKRELQGKSVLFNLGYQFRLIGVGGAPLDIALERWWRRRLIFVVQGYGLTETASVVAINSLFTARAGSVGKIARLVGVRLDNDGEILVKGKNVTPGYYNAREKTESSFEEGWLKTGDIGFIKDGYLYIKDRKKDVIITGSGLKAYPADIEAVLNKIAGIKESCVIEKDNKIHAVLILSKEVKPEEIIKKANSRLLSHQKIAGYSLWQNEDFPKTLTGKIKKYIVRQQADGVRAIGNIYQDRLYSIIDSVLRPGKRIDRNARLEELELDSLKRVELISELENRFDVEIDEAMITHDTRVRDIAAIMKERRVKRVRFKAWPLSFVASLVRYMVERLIAFPLVRIFTKTDYHGMDNIRAIKQPVILVSNHQSAFDVAVILRKVGRKVAIAGSPEVVFGITHRKNFFFRFYKAILGRLARLFLNVYPFGVEIGTEASLELTGELIDRGYSILIFPEGRRSLDGKIHRFKAGIGYLALKMDVNVVPVRIEGMYYVLPTARILPRFGKTIVKFGKPILVKDLSYLEATRLIESRVREL